MVALAPTDLDVTRGEFLTLLGPSGSGKTTLLSLVAGLTHPDEGQVFINGSDVTFGAPYERDIGLVFQNYALFPHVTVAQHVGFRLEWRRSPSPAHPAITGRWGPTPRSGACSPSRRCRIRWWTSRTCRTGLTRCA